MLKLTRFLANNQRGGIPSSSHVVIIIMHFFTRFIACGFCVSKTEELKLENRLGGDGDAAVTYSKHSGDSTLDCVLFSSNFKALVFLLQVCTDMTQSYQVYNATFSTIIGKTEVV